MKQGFFTLSALLFFVSTCLAGGWPQPKGQGYFKLSAFSIMGDEYHNDLGDKFSIDKSGVFNLNFYGEYGFSNKVTGIYNGALFSSAFKNSGVKESISSIGDMDIGLKYGLTNTVSATLLLGLPTGNDNGGLNQNLQTGDGEFNQLLQIDGGFGLFSGDKSSGYGNAYVGFNNRTSGFSDEFRFGVETGISLANEQFWIIARINGVVSLDNGDENVGSNNYTIFSNNVEYVSPALEFSYLVSDKVGISAGIAGGFSARNIFDAPSFTFGVFYDMK